MEERDYFTESRARKSMRLTCPYCRETTEHDLEWLIRTKKNQLPRSADERDRAKFAKCASYMVLIDDKTMCRNLQCRKRFDVSGIKTTAFI